MPPTSSPSARPCTRPSRVRRPSVRSRTRWPCFTGWPPDRSFRPSTPGPSRPLLLRMLAPDPDARPTMAEVADQLRPVRRRPQRALARRRRTTPAVGRAVRPRHIDRGSADRARPPARRPRCGARPSSLRPRGSRALVVAGFALLRPGGRQRPCCSARGAGEPERRGDVRVTGTATATTTTPTPARLRDRRRTGPAAHRGAGERPERDGEHRRAAARAADRRPRPSWPQR